MAKRELRHLRRRQEIAERRRAVKEAGHISETDRIMRDHRWVVWVPNGLPFAVLAIGYGLIYLLTHNREATGGEMATYFISVIVASFLAMLVRKPLLQFLINRMKSPETESGEENAEPAPAASDNKDSKPAD